MIYRRMIAKFDFKGTQFTTDKHVGWIQLGERTIFPSETTSCPEGGMDVGQPNYDNTLKQYDVSSRFLAAWLAPIFWADQSGSFQGTCYCLWFNINTSRDIHTYISNYIKYNIYILCMYTLAYACIFTGMHIFI